MKNFGRFQENNNFLNKKIKYWKNNIWHIRLFILSQISSNNRKSLRLFKNILVKVGLSLYWKLVSSQRILTVTEMSQLFPVSSQWFAREILYPGFVFMNIEKSWNVTIDSFVEKNKNYVSETRSARIQDFHNSFLI